MVSGSPSVWRNRLFSGGFAATVVAFLACLGTHVLTILGIAGAIAWLGHAEHVLVFLTVALAALTFYAWRRHLRGCKKCPSPHAHPEQQAD